MFHLQPLNSFSTDLNAHRKRLAIREEECPHSLGPGVAND